MPPVTQYPLEALASLREDKVTKAKTELAEAVQGREQAEAARLARERTREQHDEVVARVDGAERETLARGELSVADLARADAWVTGAALERGRLSDAVEQAKDAERRAVEGEGGARSELASRQAEAKVVDEHRARWNDERRRSEEAREEEATAEAWRPERTQ